MLGGWQIYITVRKKRYASQSQNCKNLSLLEEAFWFYLEAPTVTELIATLRLSEKI